jgi:hypothetical protein
LYTKTLASISNGYILLYDKSIDLFANSPSRILKANFAYSLKVEIDNQIYIELSNAMASFLIKVEKSDDYPVTFRDWMKALNKYVIRTDPLNQY